jgi:hypothetical protein
MKQNTSWLGNEQKNLEDAFFAQQDAILIAKLKQMKQMEESRKAISEVSGITNPEILQKLVDLEVRPETVAMLTLVPLIEVAWADGAIDEKEKAAIMAAVQKANINQMDLEIVERWLSRKPEPKLLEAWMHYVQGFCEKLSKEEIDSLRKGAVERAQGIAEAAGGFLGVGKISSKEKAMLNKLESAFSSKLKKA